jgi:nucleotide-binding universal stress UspA family protein
MEKILLAYDGTPESKRALETTIALCKAFNATLAVVSVVPHHPGRAPISPWDDRETHAKELIEARDLLREAGIEAQLIEPVGEPAEMIERLADKGSFDTIVVGSRGQGSVARFFQGSVSDHVATHARTTVVVAR